MNLSAFKISDFQIFFPHGHPNKGKVRVRLCHRSERIPRAMSDDPYGREEKQERIAEQKALHRPMRAWYVDVRNSKLQLEHGPFPAFWQELEAWQAWRSVRKLFLRFQDTGAGSHAFMSIALIIQASGRRKLALRR